jgi:regulator of sigma E protease
MNWLWFIPILLIMVVIHELGHFLTAKMFKMKVHEFGIGFPPKIWGKKDKSGVEWTINALPIGGFVRIEGENGDSSDPNSFGAKPTWQRAIVLAAGPFMNLVLAFVIYIFLAGVGRDVPAAPAAIMAVVPNSPAAQAGILPGDVIVSVNGKIVNQTQDFSIEAALSKNEPLNILFWESGDSNKPKRVSVQPRKNPPEGEGAIGVILGYRFDAPKIYKDEPQYGLKKGDTVVSVDGKPLTSNIELLESPGTSNNPTVNLGVIPAGSTAVENRPLPQELVVNLIYKGSQADQVGFPVGAKITKLDGTPVYSDKAYATYMTSKAGQDVVVNYTDKSNAEKTVTLRASSPTDPNTAARVPRVDTIYAGVALEVPIKRTNFTPFEMIGDAWSQTANAVVLIPRTILGLFNGSVSLNMLAGPVGMAQITDMVANTGGFIGLLTLTALLSVNLGIVNILPLPALDGGRLVFVFIEMITRGRRVPPEKEGFVHFAGMVLLLSLMAVIAWNDIVRLISGGTF